MSTIAGSFHQANQVAPTPSNRQLKAENFFAQLKTMEKSQTDMKNQDSEDRKGFKVGTFDS